MTQPHSEFAGTGDLLAHAGFVRGLARALVSGDADVDDVVQETWVAAFAADASRVQRPRSWLASIVRRRAARHHRTRIRSAQRLRMAIPKGDVPEPPTLAMQHEVIQRVSSALAALPDHERDAVVLRYYENLPPREVAKRLEVPVETARTRIRRGLEHLRRLLDERHDGQRAAWAAPLGLLLPTAPSAASTIAIVAKFAMLAAVLVLGIHVVRTVMDRGGRAGDSPSPATTAQAETDVAASLP